MKRFILICECAEAQTVEEAWRKFAAYEATNPPADFGLKLYRPAEGARPKTLGDLLHQARDMDPDRPVLLSIVSSGHDNWTADLEGFGKTGAVQGRHPRTGEVHTFEPCPTVKVGIYGVDGAEGDEPEPPPDAA